MILICLAIALHDVDGPIHCVTGEKIRLAGIGATEIDGSCRPNQPCVPGNGRAQRRAMVAAIGASISHEDAEDNGQAWFTAPVRLTCDPTGKSYQRIVAWCRLPDGRDVSCVAIRAGVAVRWAKFDEADRLEGCER
jgi:endonuclease YncB( thermonuclease family)